MRMIKLRLFSLMVTLGIILWVQTGCDRAAREKVLMFFFEGVPSSDGTPSGVGADPNIVILSKMDGVDVMNTNGRVIEPDPWGQKISSSHDFARDCAQCHTGGLRSGQQELREQVPDLCHSCHTDDRREGEFVHGPLNTGECLFCHDPHQSAYVHLQKAPEPALCFRCHQQGDIAAIPDHQERVDQVCTGCHDPHASPVRQLLKSGWEQSDDPDPVEQE